MSTSDELKALGNAAFTGGRFQEAVDHFTEAIAVDSGNHVLYSNRSAAFASLHKYQEAAVDATKCIEVNGEFAKGYGRLGAALFGLGQLAEARRAYQAGLAKDPVNAQLKSGLAAVEDKFREAAPSQFGEMHRMFIDPANIEKLKNHKLTAAAFKDPEWLAKYEDIKADPNNLMKHFQDPRMLQCLGVITGKEDEFTDEGERKIDENANDVPLYTAPPASAAAPEAAAAMEVDEEEPEPEGGVSAADKANAEAKKAAGSAAYKKKDFETAMSLYREAREIDPTNMVYLLNISAVYFETKDFENCVKTCHEAVDVGRENRAHYENIAKAFGRAGKAEAARKDLAKAIFYYNKSLSEHRTPDMLKMKNAAEKQMKEEARLAYLSPELSLEAKQRGNTLFTAGDFPGAVKEYTEAINRNPDDGKLYSNRAACYHKMFELNLALADCEECIRLDPKFIKGYLRKGGVLAGSKKWTDAQEAYEKALTIDPSNLEAKQGAQKALEAMYGNQNANASREEVAENAMRDPEIQKIMGDPVMRQILDQMQNDPGAFGEHMKNPEVARKINRLIASGILQVGSK